MSTNVIMKKNSTTTSNTSYLSMMTPNVPTAIKRRESSTGEDSVSWFSFPRIIYSLLYYVRKTP
jgi:hypothetical protein